MNIADQLGAGATWLTPALREWGIRSLTAIQAEAIRSGIADGCSMIVSSPTSSGKTLIGEIASLAALKNGKRVIYLVSHKALAAQKYRDFVRRFGEQASEPLASVGLNTGDRTEGDIGSQMIVATYEKALGLLVTGQLYPADALVVADELQILGDPTRGPEIEVLCALFRQKGLSQFIALTATTENARDLAGWMECVLVESTHRDVPLHQEIWRGGRRYRVTFGQSDGEEVDSQANTPERVLDVVSALLVEGKGPVLVFTESRREALIYVRTFGQSRQRIGKGIAVAEQLDLFTEQTESSDQLKEHAEKCITFHTADLTPQERQVIEEGFTSSQFEVCFATSTLAAGVNFPFRSIVFPKLTYQWGDRQGKHISRSDYRNMSGRAGRLGMHDDGYAILLPANRAEAECANELVKPDNDPLLSQMSKLNLHKLILMLVSSHLVSTTNEVNRFFESTLFWYQTLNNNPAKIETLATNNQAAVTWLTQNGLLSSDNGALLATPLGNAAALSGLLPTTAIQLATMLQEFAAKLDATFDEWIPGLIYAVCASDEFRSNTPTRFLPFPDRLRQDSVAYWTSRKLPIALDRADLRLAQGSHAVSLYAEGVGERKISFDTLMSSGSVHRLATDVAWVLDGLHKLTCVPDMGCTQVVSNQVAMLARRVRLGAPAEVLDVMRIADRHGVPGFGRQRAMMLLSQGISTLHDVLATAKDTLAKLLRNDQRAQALLDAVENAIGHGPSRSMTGQMAVARRLGLENALNACNNDLGTDYEKAISNLLKAEGTWVITDLDNGMRQNVPDIFIKLGNCEMLLECKTSLKSPPIIKKEEAFAVLQKAADFGDAMSRVTLGKQNFDETTKKKATASKNITLVEHSVFMEGMLRVLAGSVSPEVFLSWLATPGVADIDRLPGTPTYRM